jgi:hypothetical protein
MSGSCSNMDMKTTYMKSKPRNLQMTTRVSTKNASNVSSSRFGVALLATFAMFTGCAVRESAFRVRGRIESANNSENCTMSVYRADSGALVSKKNVNLEFQTSIVIAPGVHDYYLAISCAGSSAIYKSPVYKFGTAEQYQKPLDLGTVSLKGSP